MQANNTFHPSLIDEYETLIGELGPDPSDDRIIEVLVSESGWTRQGACAILTLAQEYGVAILRNALALAHAMKIDDGESGL